MATHRPFQFNVLVQATVASWRCVARAVVSAAAVGVLVAIGLAAPPPVSGDGRGGRGADVRLLATGDLRGEIKPCGCSPEGQRGGLPRRLTYLAGQLEGAPGHALLVDLGNNFPPPSPQGDLKIALIQQLLERFRPEAILPGPHELAVGVERLAQGLPYLASNDEVGTAFLRDRVVERGGARIGIFGFLSPEAVYQGSQARFRFVPPTPELLAALRARQKALRLDRAVLLFRGTDEELATIMAAELFDRIVVGNPFSDELNQVVERHVNGATLPQVPTKGQGVLRTTLASDAPFDIAWLGDAVDDHPDAAEPFRQYDEQVKALFFAKLETMEKQRATSPFAGAQVCAACHAPAAAAWEKSRHARAISTLERVGKQFDAECLACHVVGLDRKGYLSSDLTPHLANVQCENCHGPAKAHLTNPRGIKPGWEPAANGKAVKVEEKVCRTCHVGSHSPTFDFSVYWPKIKH